MQNTELTVPSTEEIEIVLRNPVDKQDTLSYFIEFEDSDFNMRWLDALEKNLDKNIHLEKNYCFLGWQNSARDIDYLCKEINNAIADINNFNKSGTWQSEGLESYEIKDHFDKEILLLKGEVGRGKPGLKLDHEPMNRLHRYFEDLQGEAWEISRYYKFADYNTKYAIRQLNVLCHELENWALTNRKKAYEPEWQRPAQITTFLNAPRLDLQQKDFDLFIKNRYDREFGGVYLHWAQVGKTHYEVFRDEDGNDIDDATCSAINCLKYYSGEFDVEWGQTVTGDKYDWCQREINDFKQWLHRNGMDWNDPHNALGHIKIGHINLQKSFGTDDFDKILDMVGNHLDIYKIKTPNTQQTYDYVWSDKNYKQMQIDFLKPGYDWSRANV